MLVGPCRVATRAVDHTENRVSVNEIPRVNRIAILIAREFPGIDGRKSAAEGPERRVTHAVQLRFIEVDAFIEFRGRARRCCAGLTWTASYAIPGRGSWWI